MAHKIVPTYRLITTDELPTVCEIGGTPRAATSDELLNMGIRHITDDLYDCLEQHRGTITDAGQRAYEAVGAPLPGVVIAEGFLKARLASLPASVRSRVMQAEVIRSTEPDGDIVADVRATFADVRQAIEEYVGPLDPDTELAKATNPDSAKAVKAEAQRMADNPALPAERARVRMCDVTATQVTEADGLPPHSWHGEPNR